MQIFNLKFYYLKDNIDIIKPMTQNDGLKSLYNELIKSDSEEWTIHGIKSVLQFSFHIFLSVINSVSIETSIYAQSLIINFKH